MELRSTEGQKEGGEEEKREKSHMDMKESDGASAYGASLAGRGFDLNKFVRQPQTIVRFLSWVSARLDNIVDIADSIVDISAACCAASPRDSSWVSDQVQQVAAGWENIIFTFTRQIIVSVSDSRLY